MNEFDDKIRAALRAEDTDIFKNADEPSMFEQAMTTLRGQQRLVNAYAIVVMLAVMALAVWSAIEFFQATELQNALGWATGFLLCGMAGGLMKVWFWMQMDKYVILREVKRLELQVARLSSRVNSYSPALGCRG